MLNNVKQCQKEYHSYRTIYIDKGNCFRIGKTGDVYCYFDNTEQTTVNSAGSTGGSLGLGSVADVLGIGGVVGQLANGVSIGGESSHSVSKTYSQQRVIAIPPHGNRNLTEEKLEEMIKKTYNLAHPRAKKQGSKLWQNYISNTEQ